MTLVKRGFELKIITLPLDRIVHFGAFPARVAKSAKFKTIVSSIAELGIIEPLAVFPLGNETGNYTLLDGRLRLEALRLLGRFTAPCMISLDDEGFTFNRHINRITSIQEHKMIRTSIERGASEQHIAKVLKVDVRRIRLSLHLLDGVAPEVVKMPKDRQVVPQVFKVLKKMKPMRQIEAVEMMAGANRFTINYAKMVLVTSRPEHLMEAAKSKKTQIVAEVDIVRMEKEMERLHQDYQSVEDGIGDTMLTLVIAKSFMTRLLRNENIQSHLKRHHGDLIESLMSTMEAITTDNRTLERE